MKMLLIFILEFLLIVSNIFNFMNIYYTRLSLFIFVSVISVRNYQKINKLFNSKMYILLQLNIYYWFKYFYKKP